MSEPMLRRTRRRADRKGSGLDILLPFAVVVLALLAVAFVAIPPLLPPRIKAGAASAIEVGTGDGLYSKGSGTVAFPPRLARLMTAIVLEINVETSGSPSFDSGQAMEALLGGTDVLAESAATRIAEAVAGGAQDFVELMNREARILNLERTYFAALGSENPESQYTTAQDVARLFRAAVDHPWVYQVMRETQDEAARKRGWIASFVSHSPESGYSAVALLESDQKSIVVTVMNVQSEEDLLKDMDAVAMWSLKR